MARDGEMGRRMMRAGAWLVRWAVLAMGVWKGFAGGGVRGVGQRDGEMGPGCGRMTVTTVCLRSGVRS